MYQPGPPLFLAKIGPTALSIPLGLSLCCIRSGRDRSYSNHVIVPLFHHRVTPFLKGAVIVGMNPGYGSPAESLPPGMEIKVNCPKYTVLDHVHSSPNRIGFCSDTKKPLQAGSWK